ncbi:hypothetical protein QCM77_24860 [Bradyrhizobium sp. SSUT18]|uniref:hypothetical protein n=1 Tax=Bradyrhizobium sp. SSUT18 TaxID=3040602 RepID=UPI00244B469F|nr:hypothetical protein [Bradyrhizobium sp. SSUT18]MDH2403160.1 hypothetical protein [Bradyrhizobium sp. SSUT18]
MADHELIEIQIRQHVAIRNEKRLTSWSQQRQWTNGFERLHLLGVVDAHVPPIAVPADAAKEVARISGPDVDLSDPVPTEPFEDELKNSTRTDRHNGFGRCGRKRVPSPH